MSSVREKVGIIIQYDWNKWKARPSTSGGRNIRLCQRNETSGSPHVATRWSPHDIGKFMTMQSDYDFKYLVSLQWYCVFVQLFTFVVSNQTWRNLKTRGAAWITLDVKLNNLTNEHRLESVIEQSHNTKDKRSTPLSTWLIVLLVTINSIDNSYLHPNIRHKVIMMVLASCMMNKLLIRLVTPGLDIISKPWLIRFSNYGRGVFPSPLLNCKGKGVWLFFPQLNIGLGYYFLGSLWRYERKCGKTAHINSECSVEIGFAFKSMLQCYFDIDVMIFVYNVLNIWHLSTTKI